MDRITSYFDWYSTENRGGCWKQKSHRWASGSVPSLRALGYTEAAVRFGQRNRSIWFRITADDSGARDGRHCDLMRFVIPAVAGPAKLVPLEALATPTSASSR